MHEKTQVNTATNAANPQPVSVLLLDINIPDVNGLDLFKYVKQKYVQIN